MKKNGFGPVRLAAAVLAALMLTAPAANAGIRGLAGLELHQDRDSLIAVATRGGFSLTLNQPSLLYFTPRDSAAASVQADLSGRRVIALTFQYPVLPTADEFALKEQEFSNLFGTPQGASDGDSSRIVLWQDDESRLVLKAGFSGRRGMPYVAKFFDLAALGAADQAADSTARSARKPVHSRKVHHKRTHPKAGSSR